ncbi:MAG: hypothetical protein KKF89_03275 [Nanoarchaeota archaeon]|nr:hypothetical protein [Nanoarchaeota archaeon]MBU1854717.1 hypothetical protein [Nanoarchaeota archaeon]
MAWIKNFVRKDYLYMLYYPFTTYRLWWKEFLGFNLKKVIFYWNGEYYESWRDDVEIEEFYIYLKKLCGNDKNKLDSWIDQAIKNNLILENHISTIASFNLSNVSNEEFVSFLRKTHRIIKSYWISYTLPLFASKKVEFNPSQKENFLNLRKKTLYVDFQVKALPKILSEISRRTGINDDLLYFAFPDELINIFKRKPCVEELKRRKKSYFWKNENNNIEFLSGVEAQKKYDELLVRDEDIDINLKGVSVNKGKIIGTARVVVTEHSLKTLGKNDILVTLMVRPSFYSKIKNCKAIITEEGGINSHAAILARELGIPCIVQVKNATKNIENGEKLEVDADKGMIRKLFINEQ